MRRHTIPALLVFLSVMLAAAAAQSNRGTLRGVVKDPSGGLLPGVDVKISRTRSAERSTVTNERGEFEFAGIELGRYTVTATLTAAVAEFGMLLRDSEFKGKSSFTEARALAETFKGDDPHGHRAEFIRLIGAAEGVTRLQMTRR